MRSIAFTLKIFSTFSSYALRSGSMRYSPALANPPKKTNASGVLKVAKSAQVRPSSVPVYSKTSKAILSPFSAAWNTSNEVIDSGSNSRRGEGVSYLVRNSRAVRATPVAEQ